jgi:hypothetical protein
MLLLIQLRPEAPVVPSPLVDEVWHNHILDTRRYRVDCMRMFGVYVHHAPSFGDGAQEKEELLQGYHAMLQRYSTALGSLARSDVWPVRSGSGLETCCSGECVKPACAGCVGCDALICGNVVGGGSEVDDLRQFVTPYTPFFGTVLEWDGQ